MLESFFKDNEARDGVDDLTQGEADIMTDLLKKKDASGTKHESKPHLPSVKDVKPPPNFDKMSWHEVRTYVEAGLARGDVDPYPTRYPEHLKWTIPQDCYRCLEMKLKRHLGQAQEESLSVGRIHKCIGLVSSGRGSDRSD